MLSMIYIGGSLSFIKVNKLNIGFFEINITESNDIFNKLGFTVGSNHILFTPTIKLLHKHI